jgi:hypothetical protein
MYPLSPEFHDGVYHTVIAHVAVFLNTKDGEHLSYVIVNSEAAGKAFDGLTEKSNEVHCRLLTV